MDESDKQFVVNWTDKERVKNDQMAAKREKLVDG